MDNLDETLCHVIGSFNDLRIEKKSGDKCRCLRYNEETKDFSQCGEPSVVIVDPGGVLETVFCAECYKSIKDHPAYKPLEEM